MQLDDFIYELNDKGMREKELKKNLVAARDAILGSTFMKLANGTRSGSGEDTTFSDTLFDRYFYEKICGEEDDEFEKFMADTDGNQENRSYLLHHSRWHISICTNLVLGIVDKECAGAIDEAIKTIHNVSRAVIKVHLYSSDLGWIDFR
jgi:hypothetical protein